MVQHSTRFALRGDARAIERALDWCHVHHDVLGVVEREREIELAVAGPLDRAAMPQDVDVVVLPHVESPTGLEADRPILVGPTLVVRPPWVEPVPGFRGVELVVPRGGAFGSGEHGSTRAALLALQAVWPARASRFADVGTGSGILALLAHALGAPRILACDVDPAAVATARALVPSADLVCGGPDALAERSADVVAANLSAAELAASLEALLALWTGSGALVLAGMRTAELAAVEARVPQRTVLRLERDGYWALAYGPSGA